MGKIKDDLSVTVVMATYNGENYIREQLDSLKKQTQPPNEVIIADDGSKDSTVLLIHDYIISNHLSSNWKLICNTQNKGYAKNFLDLVSYANSDLVFFCDQDDIWMPNKIEMMTKQMKFNPNIGLLCSDLELFCVGDIAPKWSKKELESMSDSKVLESITISKYNFHCHRSGCLMAIRKSFYNDVKDYWKTGWAHDDFFWKFAVFSGSCAIFHIKSVKRRMHSNNTTNIRIRSRESRLKQIDLLEIYYKSLQSFIANKKNRYKAIEEKILKKNLDSLAIRKRAIENRNFFSWIKLVLFYRDCYPWIKALLLDGYLVFFNEHKTTG